MKAGNGTKTKKPSVKAKIAALKQTDLFKDLYDNDLLDIACESEIKKYSKSQIIYREEDAADTIILILDGSVKLYTKSSEKEVLHIVHTSNDIFGFECLYNQTSRGETAKVISKNAVCLLIPIKIVIKYRRSHTSVSNACGRLLGDTINHLKNQNVDFVVKDARERIVDFLKANARTNGRQVGLEMLIKHSLTQQDIANYTGTSRQTVTYVLNDLKRENQIYFKRKSVLIRDVERLS